MEYISLLLSIFSVIFSLITFLISNKRDSYTIIDDNYRDLLDLAIKHPEFRNPEMVKNYTDYKKKDPDFYWSYNSYAFEIWNFLETLYDLNNTKRDRQFYMNHGARDLHIWDYGIPTADGRKLPLDLIIVPHYSSTFVPAKKLRSFVGETEKFIHSDFVHTDKVVDTYIHQFRDVHHNRGR